MNDLIIFNSSFGSENAYPQMTELGSFYENEEPRVYDTLFSNSPESSDVLTCNDDNEYSFDSRPSKKNKRTHTKSSDEFNPQKKSRSGKGLRGRPSGSGVCKICFQSGHNRRTCRKKIELSKTLAINKTEELSANKVPNIQLLSEALRNPPTEKELYESFVSVRPLKAEEPLRKSFIVDTVKTVVGDEIEMSIFSDGLEDTFSERVLLSPTIVEKDM